MIGTFKVQFITFPALCAIFLYIKGTVSLKIMHIFIKHWKMYPWFYSCTRYGMDFGANSVLERVAFGSKCVLHRVRVSQCRPSRVIQNPAEQPPRVCRLWNIELNIDCNSIIEEWRGAKSYNLPWLLLLQMRNFINIHILQSVPLTYFYWM